MQRRERIAAVLGLDDVGELVERSAATAPSSASRFAKWRYGAAGETPTRAATARSVRFAGPVSSTSVRAASTSARGRSPW